jgi:hypothetical protein
MRSARAPHSSRGRSHCPQKAARTVPGHAFPCLQHAPHMPSRAAHCPARPALAASLLVRHPSPAGCVVRRKRACRGMDDVRTRILLPREHPAPEPVLPHNGRHPNSETRRGHLVQGCSLQPRRRHCRHRSLRCATSYAPAPWVAPCSQLAQLLSATAVADDAGGCDGSAGALFPGGRRLSAGAVHAQR